MKIFKMPGAGSSVGGAEAGRSPAASPAFTLVELLTVIAIIGVLAAFLLTVGGAVTRTKYLSTATAEMTRIETALERYKAQYGAYPPAGTNVLVNPLYDELTGVTNTSPQGTFRGPFNTLDGNVMGLSPLMFGMSEAKVMAASASSGRHPQGPCCAWAASRSARNL